jgi:hypothetical protein
MALDPCQLPLLSLAQAFSAWIHICAVRLFVESILRYGLPPKFLAALMKPAQKTIPKLRKVLATTFGEGEGKSALARLNAAVPCSQRWRACGDAHALDVWQR